MKLSLSLLLSVAVADFVPAGTASVGNPAGCPKITCVMFCTNGLQKDDQGCDKCSCVRGTGKVATTTQSCQRDAHGCCSELGVAWCPDQNFCVSTRPGAVIPCKSWGNNPPATTSTAAAATTSTAAAAATSTTLAVSGQVAPTFGASATFTTFGATSTLPVIPAQSGLSSASVMRNQPAASSIPTLPPIASSSLTSPVSSSPCSQVLCALYCPNGFQKDSRGCNTCACAGSSNGQCAPVDCGSTTCTGGFSKDSNGCSTCICLAGAVTIAPPQVVRPATSSLASVSSNRVASSGIGSSVQADTLVAVNRPSVALNPCLPSPCRSTQRCVPSPKQCIQAPCPQYTCVKRATSGTPLQ